jgi:hypothetical protein
MTMKALWARKEMITVFFYFYIHIHIFWRQGHLLHWKTNCLGALWMLFIEEEKREIGAELPSNMNWNPHHHHNNNHDSHTSWVRNVGSFCVVDILNRKLWAEFFILVEKIKFKIFNVSYLAVCKALHENWVESKMAPFKMKNWNIHFFMVLCISLHKRHYDDYQDVKHELEMRTFFLCFMLIYDFDALRGGSSFFWKCLTFFMEQINLKFF